MIIEMHNFIIKEGKWKEFQDWVKANEELLVRWAKKAGMKYRGTYYYTLGTGAHVNADGCMMWEYSKYGDIDKAWATVGDPDEEKVTREMGALCVNTPSSMLLLRPFGEVPINEGT